MDRRKALIGLPATIIILLSLLTPMLLVQPASTADPSEWYKTVDGVLATDYYSLYPFEEKSLKVGFSQFGELIDSNTNVGLEYAGARDPFAPVAGAAIPPELNKSSWINGWYIDIRYNHSVWGYRNVWAGALFADIVGYGGPWLRVDNNYNSCTYEWQEAFNLPGKAINPNNPRDVVGELMNGGRKTNGTVITEPMKILYNSSRLFVAEIVNHIYDWYEPTKVNLHIVDLVITLIFNKVKKEVIVIKDVKLAPPAKYVLATLMIQVNGQKVKVPYGVLVQLSNREEWDLGSIQPGTTSYSSYVHFYRGLNTVYNASWTVLPTLPASTTIKGVTINAYGGQPAKDGTYDVAIIISNDKKYVGWHAFWPSVSDWSVTAGDDGTWYRALKKDDPHTEDNPIGEPWRSPLVVGEWDFILSDQRRTPGENVVADVQFRAVSVYGVTDLNDGDDANMGRGHSNKIDSEVEYQLAQIFNPWDLNAAVHKATQRFVIIETKEVTAETKISYCVGSNAIISKEADKEGKGNPSGTSWYDYCNATERVIVDGVLISPKPKKAAPYYNATLGADGKWYINVTIPKGTHTIKILWSNMTAHGRYEWIVVGRDAHSIDSAGAAMVSEAFDSIKDIKVGIAGADMKETVVWNAMPWVMRRFGTANDMAAYKDRLGRAALKDDWCTKWPIASSNMIVVGGPLANMLAYYFNDFTSALFGLREYAASAWDDKVIALPCWSKNTYASSNETGYAVIAVYKDINGTAGLLIWGHWGRDTYYASQWLWGDAESGIPAGIEQLQNAPKGVTAIILEIDFSKDPEHPKFRIVEVLGTISERLWTHNEEKKGGIHPDP